MPERRDTQLGYKLTDMQYTVWELMAWGKDRDEISKELFLSKDTIGSHTTKVFEQLHLDEISNATKRVHAILMFWGVGPYVVELEMKEEDFNVR